MTQSDCLSYCSVTPECVAVDILTSCAPIQCWVHMDASKLLDQYKDNPYVIQYIPLNHCERPLPTAPPTPTCNCDVRFNVKPGQMAEPCTTQLTPQRMCPKDNWETKDSSPRLTILQTPCVMETCCGEAQKITYLSQTKCVVPGWSEWTKCSAGCGAFGKQYRYNYAISNNLYITCSQEERVCNIQPCSCAGSTGCTRCCTGYREDPSGFCVLMYN